MHLEMIQHISASTMLSKVKMNFFSIFGPKELPLDVCHYRDIPIEPGVRVVGMGNDPPSD